MARSRARSGFLSGRTRDGILDAAVALALIAAAPSIAPAHDYELGELQVELYPGGSINVINAQYGTTTLDSLPPLYLLKLPQGGGEDEYLNQLLADPRIHEAEYSFDGETPEGARGMVVAAVGGTITDYLDQHLVQRIHLAEIQEHTKGDGVIVAVIDTGVLASHEALGDAVLSDGYDFMDDDADPTDSVNGLDDDQDGDTDEGAGHGTMVAGIVHLVAPNAKILPIRVLNDEGEGTTFKVAKGIRYAVEHGARVINLSLGLTTRSFVIGHEVDLADSLSVSMASAAGNLGAQDPQYYPASDNDVLSIAALDSSDVKADFSNWHSTVDLSAPGVGIFAPYYDGQYAIGAGTSFSVPFITGQCALILAMNPALTINDVYAIASLGVEGIYQIPGNELYVGKLGSGRFDGLATWLNIPASAGIAAGDPFLRGPALSIYPNPASLGSEVHVRLFGAPRPTGQLAASIHDAQGRRVRSLDFASAGADPNLVLRWDGRDEFGRAAPAGTYFIRVGSGPTRLGSARIVTLAR